MRASELICTTMCAATALAALGCGEDETSEPVRPKAGVAALNKEAATPSAPEIPTGAGPGYAAVAFGSVWVGNHQDDTVVAIDPETQKVTARVEVPGEPTGVEAGFASVWTTTPLDGGPKLRRLDPKSGRLAKSIALPAPGGPESLLAAAGALWVAAEEGRLVRVDPRRNRATVALQLPEDESLCSGDLAFAAGDLWFTPGDCGGSRVLRIDPARRRIVAKIDLGDRFAAAVEAHRDRVWVLTQDGEVIRLDARRNRIAKSAGVASQGGALAYGDGSLWVRESARKAHQVDAATLAVKRTVTLPDGPLPSGMAVASGSLWATNFAKGSVTVIR